MDDLVHSRREPMELTEDLSLYSGPRHLRVPSALRFLSAEVRRFTRRKGRHTVLRMRANGHRDPVVEFYMKDVDRSLLRENLKLTPGQRLEKLVRFSAFAAELRAAGARARASRKS